MNRTNPTMVSRKWLQQESTPITKKKSCGHCCHCWSRHQSDPKVVRWRPSLSQHSQWIGSCELIRSRSGCCCCAASACHCPSPSFFARVAVLLTSLAITEQHAARWGGAQQERLCSGECCRPDLSRRRGQGVHQRHGIRRLEVIAEGLSLFGGVQLALDATLVSAHHGDGTPLR